MEKGIHRKLGEERGWLLRRTENSLRVGDELQERRNTTVSLLISAGGRAFQMV